MKSEKNIDGESSSPNTSPKRGAQIQRSKSITSTGKAAEITNGSSNSKKESSDSKAPSSPNGGDNSGAMGGAGEFLTSGASPNDQGEDGKEPGDEKSPVEGHNALSKFHFDDADDESRACCAKRDHILGIKVSVKITKVSIETVFRFRLTLL